MIYLALIFNLTSLTTHTTKLPLNRHRQKLREIQKAYMLRIVYTLQRIFDLESIPVDNCYLRYGTHTGSKIRKSAILFIFSIAAVIQRR
jgi:hypothetical protein